MLDKDILIKTFNLLKLNREIKENPNALDQYINKMIDEDPILKKLFEDKKQNSF